MDLIIAVVLAVIVGIVGFAAAWMLAHNIGEKSVSRAEEQAKRRVAEAERQAEILKKEAAVEAREEAIKIKSAIDRELDEKRREMEKFERRLDDRESNLQKKQDVVDVKERDLSNRDKTLQGREKGITLREQELGQLITSQNDKLQRIAQMSPEEAKRQLMENMLYDAKVEAAAHIKEIRDAAERDAEKESKEIILRAIYRCAAEHTVETTVSVVNLPSDEMKGRIIGREGRNIRAFETATGVDVIVDDTPEAVILSGYDPVRREIARIALERLMTDGRIHPTRIEEVVDKAQREMDVRVREAGEQACFELGIHNLHIDVIRLLGKLNYRTSYGQNVLAHSKEVAQLCGLMASELDLDPLMAKRCGLLHDIGKAIDRETEGTHTQIGADFMRRFKEHEYVINAIEAHHNDVPIITPYVVLVQTADAVSGARPGARREPLESYIKRLTQLEALADSFKGVNKAYAIQAGREVRVIVENEKVDDLAAQILASDIAAKIEAEMQYPGQVKVTVIRETRATEYAK